MKAAARHPIGLIIYFTCGTNRANRRDNNSHTLLRTILAMVVGRQGKHEVHLHFFCLLFVKHLELDIEEWSLNRADSMAVLEK